MTFPADGLRTELTTELNEGGPEAVQLAHVSGIGTLLKHYYFRSLEKPNCAPQRQSADRGINYRQGERGALRVDVPLAQCEVLQCEECILTVEVARIVIRKARAVEIDAELKLMRKPLKRNKVATRIALQLQQNDEASADLPW